MLDKEQCKKCCAEHDQNDPNEALFSKYFEFYWRKSVVRCPEHGWISTHLRSCQNPTKEKEEMQKEICIRCIEDKDNLTLSHKRRIEKQWHFGVIVCPIENYVVSTHKVYENCKYCLEHTIKNQ